MDPRRLESSNRCQRRSYRGRCPSRSRCGGERIEVLIDGGIRRGSDIAKALCIGARAVLVGRAYAYGLGAAGGAGVARAIEILCTDLIRTLKLLGCASTAELDRSFISLPPDWLASTRQVSAKRASRVGRSLPRLLESTLKPKGDGI